jgi:glutamate--cysteine ligase catalytic subunit
LTANIRKRRGEKVAVNLPIFVDHATPQPFREALPKVVEEMLKSKGLEIPKSLVDYEPSALENHVYMDAMCFGMGCSCLQVTIQACTLESGRRLYDHLTVLTPIMLSLSAAAPIFRGFLVDVDCRWEVIAGSVDDRTRQERGLDPLTTDRFVIPKSRYESVSRYLSPGPNVSGTCQTIPDFDKSPNGSEYFNTGYNDLPEVYDETIFNALLEEGMLLIYQGIDDLLAAHYAHLFIRDPLVVFKEMLDIDDEVSNDHFEVHFD